MKKQHKILLALCRTIMAFSVLVFVLSLTLAAVFGKPEQTKGWVKDSGLYLMTTNTIKDSFVSETQDLDASNEIVYSAINQTLTEVKVQGYSEDAIDAVYAWLEGKTEKPEFAINVEEIKTEFATAITSGLTTRAQTLPACSRKVQPTTNDVFTINCIPPGTNIQGEIEKVRAQILAADTSQATEQSPMDVQNIQVETAEGKKPFYQAQPSVQTWYKLAKLLPLITVLSFLVAFGFVVVLSNPRYLSLKTLAGVTLPYGIIYVIAGLAMPPTIKTSIEALVKQAEKNDFTAPVQHIAQDITGLIGSYLLKLGIGLLVVGSLSLATYKVVQKRSPEAKADKAEQPKDSTPAHTSK